MRGKGDEGKGVPGRGSSMCKVPEVERQIRLTQIKSHGRKECKGGGRSLQGLTKGLDFILRQGEVERAEGKWEG